MVVVSTKPVDGTDAVLTSANLADYLRNYYDKRNAVAESYAYGTQKAKNTNLETICRDDPLSGRAGCENPRM